MLAQRIDQSVLGRTRRLQNLMLVVGALVRYLRQTLLAAVVEELPSILALIFWTYS